MKIKIGDKNEINNSIIGDNNELFDKNKKENKIIYIIIELLVGILVGVIVAGIVFLLRWN